MTKFKIMVATTPSKKINDLTLQEKFHLTQCFDLMESCGQIGSLVVLAKNIWKVKIANGLRAIYMIEDKKIVILDILK